MEPNISYIDRVIHRTVCHKHKMDLGQACYVLQSHAGVMLRGVCNKRLIKAGFIGKINPLSLSQGVGRGGRTNARSHQGGVRKSSMG